jgi:outer membrane autotransporter protein
MRPFGAWANQGSRDGLAGYKADTTGLALGMERDVTSSLNVGVAFIYAKSNIDSEATQTRQGADVDLYQAMAYGTHSFDGHSFIDFHVGLGHHKNKGYREIVLFPAVASSNYEGRSYHFGAALGCILPISGRTRFVPSLRADYVQIKNDGYQETGGALKT